MAAAATNLLPKPEKLAPDIFQNLKEDTKQASRRRAYSDTKQVSPDTSEPNKAQQKQQLRRKRDVKDQSKQQVFKQDESSLQVQQ